MNSNSDLYQLLDGAWQQCATTDSLLKSTEIPDCLSKISIFSCQNSSDNDTNFSDTFATLHNTLKLSVISAWAYHNLPMFHKDKITVKDLCNKGFTPYTKEHDRLLNKVQKASKNLCIPSDDTLLPFLKLYSPFQALLPSSIINNVYSYNGICNLILNWNHLVAFFRCDDSLDLSESTRGLLNVIYSDLPEVSKSKTELGTIAPVYIIHQHNNAMFDAYFLLDLLHYLYCLQKKIENTVIKNASTALTDEIKGLKNNASFHVKNHSMEIAYLPYNYELHKEKYFLFLYAALQIGQCQSLYMKSFLLDTLYQYMYPDTPLSTLYIPQNTRAEYHEYINNFTLYCKTCNNLYRHLYDKFSFVIKEFSHQISNLLISDASLLDQYLLPISKPVEHIQSLYSKLKNVPRTLEINKEKQATLRDLLIIRANKYQPTEKYEQHFCHHISLCDIMRSDESTLSFFSPVNQHFVSFENLMKKDKACSSLFDQLSHASSISSQIIKPKKTSSIQNLSVKITKTDP